MGSKKLRSFTLVPGSGRLHELREILARLAWYGEQAISAGANLVLPMDAIVKDALSAGAPFWAGNEARDAYRGLASRILDESIGMPATDIIHWRQQGTATGFQNREHHDWYLSPWGDPDGEQKWLAFAETLAAHRAANDRHELLAHVKTESHNRVLLVGPGPSLQQLGVWQPGDTVIMTLSAYLNLLPDEFKQPDILIFSDALSVVGPSSVAQANRDALISAARSGVLLVTTASIARLLESRLPLSLRQKLLGFTVSDASVPQTAQALIDGPLPRTNNVLTMLGLPIAASLSKRVRLIGFDGVMAQNGEFRHRDDISQMQRVSLLRAAHPRIGLPQEYYEKHRQTTAYMARQLGQLKLDITPPLLGSSSAPVPPPEKYGPLTKTSQRLYDALDRIDRMPVPAVGLCGGLVVIVTILIWHFSQRSPPLESILGSTVASLLLVLLGIFYVRRRQNQQIERLRHDVISTVQEMHQITVQRLDRLEQTSKSEADNS